VDKSEAQYNVNVGCISKKFNQHLIICSLCHAKNYLCLVQERYACML